jgi:nucleoside-diphosphate-sugar epimerase
MIAGDVTNKKDVDKVFENDIDGVIVALGGKTADVGETMLTDGTKNVIAAMKEKGVQRLAVVTSIGAGDSENQAPFFFKVSSGRSSVVLFQDGISLNTVAGIDVDSHEEDLHRQEQPRRGYPKQWFRILHS